MKRNLSTEPAQENNPPGKVAHCCLVDLTRPRGSPVHASSALLSGASLTLLTLRTARSLITDGRESNKETNISSYRTGERTGCRANETVQLAKP